LPDTTAFKLAAERGGDGYTLDQLIAAETHNELARLRSSYHAVHGGEDAVYTPHEFINPAIQRLRDELQAAEDAERADDDDDFYADMGWS